MDSTSATSSAPYLNAELSIAQRVEDLLARMSVEEKAGQLVQYFYTGTGEPLPADFDLDSLPPEHRVFVELPRQIEEAVQRGQAGSLLFVRNPSLSNRLQRLAVEDSKLGIPLLFGFDVVHGWRTVFPVPVAMAATWSGAAVERAQQVAARESRAAGVHWTFAPMIDIARDSRWGRIVEGAGEDPLLGSVMAAAAVRGFQGDFGGDRILAGPKHFVGYGAARGGRDYDDVEMSDSELWNVYIPPFRAAIKAGAVNVMTAYMDFNGVPASGNRKLLTTILRDGLGFDGFVGSDANAVKSLEAQHFAQDQVDAASRALSAGVDMEMCMFGPAFDNLPLAVRKGAVTEQDLDAAVRRVLAVKFRLGLFERPYADESAVGAILTKSDHRELSREIAQQSFVLLRNAEHSLPLIQGSLRRVAVIGQLADSKRDTLGPWVFDHDASETVTIVEGLKSRLDDSVLVEFEPGASIPERVHPTPFDAMDASVERTPEGYDDDEAIDRAIALAADADVAIVVVGQRQNQIGEKASVSTLDLPGRQLEQLQRIHETGTKIVLVVMSGRPLDLRWADAHVPAIIQAWYPGTRGGEALASVLLGEASPAGRLPFTWPRHAGQLPLTYSHNRTFAPEDQHTRYFEETNQPLYPFGHGLSYATFAYDDLRLSRTSIAVGESTTVSVRITNTSTRAADEVVQMYTHQRHGLSSRPVRELKGFERISLGAGQTAVVTFEVGPEQLRYWSAVTDDFVQDPTTHDIWVGGSSEAALSAELTVADTQATA